MRLIFLTDFTEQFAYRLLKGILDYAKDTGEPWTVCKMPPSFKREKGIAGVARWASEWRADVIIGQFDPDDDLRQFKRRGIVAIAQDYISRFDSIPNITADYFSTGAMAATFFLTRGFKNFGFLGYGGVCWSDDRRKGFVKILEDAGVDSIFINESIKIDSLWYSDFARLGEWLTTLPKPVAIMACDDNQANVLLQVCNAYGFKVPSEVAMIGVDNDEILCGMSDPSLSSINVDIERGGYETARLATQMVRERRFKGDDIVLQPTNVVPRSSSNIFPTEDQAVLAALQYISANAMRKITVNDILEKVPLSRRLLEQRFLRETGSTIYQYIIMVRMNIFARMLLESDEPISNIAAKFDEPDTKSLSRRFLAVKGCTPSEFRKKQRGK